MYLFINFWREVLRGVSSGRSFFFVHLNGPHPRANPRRRRHPSESRGRGTGHILCTPTPWFRILLTSTMLLINSNNSSTANSENKTTTMGNCICPWQRLSSRWRRGSAPWRRRHRRGWRGQRAWPGKPLRRREKRRVGSQAVGRCFPEQASINETVRVGHPGILSLRGYCIPAAYFPAVP